MSSIELLAEAILLIFVWSIIEFVRGSILQLTTAPPLRVSAASPNRCAGNYWGCFLNLGRQAREPGVSGTTYWTGRESGRRCDGPNEGPDCCALRVVPEAESVQIGTLGSLPSNPAISGPRDAGTLNCCVSGLEIITKG